MTESQRKNAESQRKPPDREKVIRGLECIAQQPQNGTCDGCAYFRPFRDDPDCGRCDKVAIVNDTLAMLREQDTVEHALAVLKAHGWKDGAGAVEPTPTGIEPNYNCGQCGLPIQQGYPFCPWCGSKVKWDD